MFNVDDYMGIFFAHLQEKNHLLSQLLPIGSGAVVEGLIKDNFT